MVASEFRINKNAALPYDVLQVRPLSGNIFSVNMPPRLLSRSTFRTGFGLSRASGYACPGYVRLALRYYSSQDDGPLSKADKSGSGPNQQQLPHVSEEAAAMSKITGEQGPELEKGTPVQEVQAKFEEMLRR